MTGPVAYLLSIHWAVSKYKRLLQKASDPRVKVGGEFLRSLIFPAAVGLENPNGTARWRSRMKFVWMNYGRSLVHCTGQERLEVQLLHVARLEKKVPCFPIFIDSRDATI